jgi:hypothetical protein
MTIKEIHYDGRIQKLESYKPLNFKEPDFELEWPLEPEDLIKLIKFISPLERVDIKEVYESWFENV